MYADKTLYTVYIKHKIHTNTVFYSWYITAKLPDWLILGSNETSVYTVHRGQK